MLRVWLAVFAGLALAGCQDREALRAQAEASHDATCKSLGALPGSDAYVNCRVQLMQVAATEDHPRQQRRQNIANALGNSISSASRSYSQTYSQATAPRSITCSSTRYGDTTRTTCD